MNKHVKALSVVLGLVLVGAAGYYVLQSQVIGDSPGDGERSTLSLNQPVPDFHAETILGKPIQLANYKGKAVILNFWASWCGPCVEEMPSLIKLVKAFPKDVELVAISGDSNMEDIESFLKSFPEMKTLPNVHVIFDQKKELMEKYQIQRLPESFVLGKDQKVAKKISGTIDWHTPDALEYMKKLSEP
jgi:cytochrome c biogenesis protein CcmG/thiol:disulfide interchange protein DsbE